MKKGWSFDCAIKTPTLMFLELLQMLMFKLSVTLWGLEELSKFLSANKTYDCNGPCPL